VFTKILGKVDNFYAMLLSIKFCR